MKIAIITVFNSPNLGSCWQARALYTVLKKLGHEVVIYDTKARNTWKQVEKPLLLIAGKAMLTARFNKARFHYEKLKAFRKNYAAMQINDKPSYLGQCDIVIFGSDEIWNVQREEMSINTVFWGNGIEGAKKVSYAVSVNNATYEELLSFGAEKYLQDFKYISVRDKWSAEQIKGLCKQKIACVVDPTLLLDSSYYQNFKRKNVEEGYIALYYFGVDEQIKETVQALAKKTNKKVISIGVWLDWCDDCVVGENPFSYYLDADYVITNTFHGTAFAINLEKNFVSVSVGKKKIQELLCTFGLEDRAVSHDVGESDIRLLIDKPIDWNNVRERVDEQRSYSKLFLEHALGEVRSEDIE